MEINLSHASDGIHREISGFVLAGGSSSRLGQDKVLLPWHGQTLLHHAVVRLRQVCGTVSVCANRDDLSQHLPPSVAIVQDAIAGAGPLGGIVPALEASQTDWNLFLAVDLPLVPTEFLRMLAAQSKGDDIVAEKSLCVLPQIDGFPQPLCGLYHRSLAPGMRRALEEGKYKIMLALPEAISATASNLKSPPDSMREFQEDAAGGISNARIRLLDVQALKMPVESGNELAAHEWFLNINTQSELQRARDLSVKVQHAK
jgi:molybdopterin-guanine dinucleotide biosynthesis protein A